MDRGPGPVNLDGSVVGILLKLKFLIELNGKVPLFMWDEGVGQGSEKFAKNLPKSYENMGNNGEKWWKSTEGWNWFK